MSVMVAVYSSGNCFWSWH